MQVSLKEERRIWLRGAVWFYFRHLLAMSLIANFIVAFFGVEWVRQQIDSGAPAMNWLLVFLEWPLELRLLALMPITFLLSLPVALVAQGPYPRLDRG